VSLTSFIQPTLDPVTALMLFSHIG